MKGQVIHYSDENYLNNILTRNNIIVKNNVELTIILNDILSSCQEILFIIIDNEESSEKINEKYHYILCLYSSFINGQKVLVILFGI